MDWKSLTPKIEAALQEGMKLCNDERRWIAVVQTEDVTGDRIPEALVEYCHMGAYTSEATLVKLENGNPVPARFRDKKGNLAQPNFLRGASVRNGENAALLPEYRAVYAIHWHADDSGRLETCSVEAYGWNAKTGTFDANRKLSGRVAQSECHKLKNQLECEATPCPK
jgi:hypothetical protein